MRRSSTAPSKACARILTCWNESARRRSARAHSADASASIGGGTMPEVNWIAIILAAASSLLVGFAWYSPALFNKAWMREVGMTEEKARTGNMALIFGGAFALALVQCFCLAMFFGREMPWQQTTF